MGQPVVRLCKGALTLRVTTAVMQQLAVQQKQAEAHWLCGTGVTTAVKEQLAVTQKEAEARLLETMSPLKGRQSSGAGGGGKSRE